MSTALARSILPTADDSLATGRINGSCTVRLVRRTSKSVACFPEGDARSGGQYGCIDNATMFTRWKCAGLFQCGNGALTMCGGHDSNYKQCSCKEPCHHIRSEYIGSSCPPGPPAIPFPPPLPPVPPMPPPPLAPDSQLLTYLFTSQLNSDHTVVQASCAAWCDKGAHALEQHHWCKCASCKNMTRPPLEEGTPCWHGLAVRASPPPASFVNGILGTLAATLQR